MRIFTRLKPPATPESATRTTATGPSPPIVRRSPAALAPAHRRGSRKRPRAGTPRRSARRRPGSSFPGADSIVFNRLRRHFRAGAGRAGAGSESRRGGGRRGFARGFCAGVVPSRGRGVFSLLRRRFARGFGAAPFSGANSIFSSACGAISGRSAGGAIGGRLRGRMDPAAARSERCAPSTPSGNRPRARARSCASASTGRGSRRGAGRRRRSHGSGRARARSSRRGRPPEGSRATWRYRRRAAPR